MSRIFHEKDGRLEALRLEKSPPNKGFSADTPTETSAQLKQLKGRHLDFTFDPN